MPAPDSVANLVGTFKEHLKHYKSQKYNETQLRREFLVGVQLGIAGTEWVMNRCTTRCRQQ